MLKEIVAGVIHIPYPGNRIRKILFSWNAWFALYNAASLWAQPYGLSTRPNAQPFLGGLLPEAAPAISGNWTAVVAYPHLLFTNAVGLTHMPGTSNLVVWEREGRAYSFAKSANTETRTLILDVSAQCQGWDDSGLLGLAFHPQFESNRFVFVWYTFTPPGTIKGNANTRPPVMTPNRDRLARFTMDAGGKAIPGSETVLIEQNAQSVWHNGGGMFFHPENGFLYFTNGDDARGADTTQVINKSLFSGVFRIDVDQRGGAISHPPPRQPLNGVTAHYYIPKDNPFVGQTNVLEEFFALGLRSPHRMTFDPVSRRIFIGDVGEGSREEISVIDPSDPPGLNFQWNRIEGLAGDLRPPYIGVNKRPIIDYGHNEGQAVIGGYVYRGREFAIDLGGKYIFGDNVQGQIWALDESVNPAAKVLLCLLPDGEGPRSGDDYTGLSSFGLDDEGELYICQMSSLGGRIYRLARSGPPPVVKNFPRLLSETGAFQNTADLTPSAGFIPFDVNSPLWSDEARKTRWMSIPSQKQIGFAPLGEWTFPDGSVWVKHFELAVDDLNPTITRRLETRLLVRNTNGYVYGITYKWRSDNSDAELLEGALREPIPIAAVPIGSLTGVDIGGSRDGATSPFPGGYAVTGGGADIWNASDQFHFAYRSHTGDFDWQTRIESLTDAHLYAKAGFMVRENLAATSRNLLALVFPKNADRNLNQGGYEFQFRETAGGSSAAIYPAEPQPKAAYPNTWLRLKRHRDLFIAYASADGTNWWEYARHSMIFPATVYLGLAVTSHDPNLTATAQFHFRNVRYETWYYPSRQDCLACHSRAAKGVLGVKTSQSNRDFHYASSGITDNQLRAWNHIGLFSPGLEESAIAGMLKLAPLTSSTASVEVKARSYLDANCSHCHRPGGVRAFWDGRIDTPLDNAGIVNGLAGNNLGIAGARIVLPGSIDRSILHRRVNTTGEDKMPPLARNLIDFDGVEILAAWIKSLPPSSIALPYPWLQQDIGAVGQTGDAMYQAGLATVFASGEDIWNTADGFRFVYQSITNDTELSVKVESIDNTDPWAKAGLMLRDNLLPGSRHVFVCITAGQGSGFQRRISSGGASEHTPGPQARAPYWVRLRRTGNLFEGFISADGAAWTKIGELTLALRATLFGGLAVTAHNNRVLNASTFSSFRGQGFLPFVYPPRISVAGAAGGNFQFSFNAEPGVSYVLERSGDLKAWLAFSTNQTDQSSISISQPAALGTNRYYRAVVRPN